MDHASSSSFLIIYFILFVYYIHFYSSIFLPSFNAAHRFRELPMEAAATSNRPHTTVRSVLAGGFPRKTFRIRLPFQSCLLH
ncbi:hypothetical protein ACSQ67_009980 [Phaseolus vulgaris]